MQKFLRTLMLVALMAVPFASRAQVTTFPYSCDFEDATEATAWTFVNGTLTNQWVLGNAANNTTSGSYGIYISNDAGTSAAYTVSSAAVVYAYREFYLTPGEYTVTFDWKCNGESTWDYLLAALVNDEVTLTAGTALPSGVSYTAMTAAGWTNLGPTTPNLKMNLSTTWNTQTATFTVTTAGTYRIVFVWRNDTSGGTAPGACVDNVVVTQNSCPTPSNLLISNITATSMDLAWTEIGTATSWLVYVNGEYVATTNSASYSLTGLNGNTLYTIAVRSFCGTGDTSNAVTGTSRTACPESVALPYVEEFNGYSGFQSNPYTGPSISPACWGYYSNGTNTASTTTNAYYGGVFQYSSNSSYGSMEANNPYLCLPIYVIGSNASSTYIGYRNARGDVKYAILPALATPISGLQIGFDYKMSTANSATGANTVLELGYTTGDDTSTFVSMWSATADNTTLQHVVDLNLSTLAAQAPQGARLAFKFHGTHNGTGTSSYSTVYCGIDNIHVEALPSCFRVTNLTASGLTNNSVTLNWVDATNTGATYTVYKNDTLVASGISGMSYTVTGLNGNSDYTFDVVTNCSANDASTATTINVHTDCDAMTTLPYLQTFENEATGSGTSAAFAECWTRLNNGTQYFGYPYISSSTTYNHTDGGTKGLYWTNSITAGTYGDYQCIVLPEIGGNYSVSGCRVKFWAKASSTSYHPVFYVGAMTNAHDINSFVVLDSVNVEGTTWTEYTVNLNGYNGNGTFVAIAAVRPASSWYAYVDDILLEELPSCVEISDLTAGNITSNSVTLTWSDAVNTGATYTVSKNDTLVASGISGTTYTVTGLNANTQYTFSVVANCSATDASSAITVSGKTLCGLMTLPYNETFDSYTTNATSSTTPTGYPNVSMPDCWTFVNMSESTSAYPQAFLSAYSTYAVSGNCLFFKSSSTTQLYAILPAFETPTSHQEITFSYRNEGTSASNGTISVGMMGSDNVFVPIESLERTTTITEHTTILPVDLFANGARIAFCYTGGTSNNYYAAIDNVDVHDAPSCLTPTNLTANYIGGNNNAAEISWVSDATLFNLEMNGNVTYGVTANPTTITGLDAATTYTFRVQASCGNDTSEWSEPVSLTTPCEPNTVFPWSEDFESYTASSTGVKLEAPCWVNEHISGTGSYFFEVYSGAQGGNSTQKLRLHDMANGTQTKLMLPAMDIPTGTTKQFSIDVYRNATGTSYTSEGVRVFASTNGEIEGATELGFLYRNCTQTDGGIVTAESTSGWYTYDFVIPFTGTVYIILRGESQYGSATYLDNFVINDAPSCPAVTGVTATPNGTSVLVSWNDNGATSFDVELRQNGEPVAGFSPVINGTTATISGLLIDNDYQVVVRSVCGNDYGEWSTPASVHIGYCLPNPTSVDNDGITSVSFGNLENASTHPTAAPYYGNYSNLVGSVPAGTTATVNVTYATGYTYGTIVWVDWNNNLAFEGNEVVAVGTSTNTDPTTLTLTFGIPATQATGLYRMRIAGADSYYDNYTSSIDAAANANPCGSYSYGVAEDYTLYVTEAPSCLPVSGVTIDEVSNTSITVSFTPSSAPAFDVHAYTSDMVDTYVTTTTGTATITGLTAGTTYYVRVQAHCDENTWSILTDPIEVTTALCPIADQCNITIVGTDDYNDGWDGAFITVAQNNTPLATFEAEESEEYGDIPVPTTANIGVCTGSPVTFTWTPSTSTYSYPSEVHFAILNAQGDTLYSISDATNLSGLFYTLNDPCSSSDTTGSDTTVVTEVATINMSVNDSTMGTIVPAPGTYTYGEGDTITFTAIPNDGFHFVNWVADYSDYGLGLIPIDTALVWNYVVSDYDLGTTMNISANFASDTSTVVEGLTLELAVNDTTMGTTVPAPGTHVFAVGDTLSFDVIAYEGYHFDSAIYSVSMMGQTMMEDTVTDLSEMAMFNNTVVESYMTSISASVMVFFSADTTADTTIVDPCLVTLPYTEDFEGADLGCWTTDGPGTWTIATGDYNSSTGSYSGSTNAKITHSSTGNVTKLISPAISGAETGVMLSFAHVERSWAGDIDELRVYSRASENAAWQMVAEYTNEVATWTLENITIGGNVYQVAFEMTDSYGYGVGIDAVNIIAMGSDFCFAPTNIAVSDLTTTSATLTWSGEADNYQVVVSNGTTDVYNNVVADSTVAITGLTAETNYNVAIRAICGVGDTSSVTTATFFTGYCTPNPTSVDNSGITSVSFGGMTNTTSHAGSTAAYVNNSAMAGSVPAGTTATLDITYATGYTYGTVVWVDWNNNLTFDGNEVVAVGTSTNSNPTTLTLTFDIPATQALGNYRMRILGSDSYFDSYTSSIAAAANANPCGTYSYGVAEDYTLTVTEAPACLTPTGLTVTYEGGTTAIVSWTSDANAFNLSINGTVTYNVNNPDTITGLDLATAYTFMVQTDCGTDTSEWTNPVSIQTDNCMPEDQCQITIYAQDSYGDGWTGSAINVMQNGVTVTSYSMPSQNLMSTVIYDTAVVTVCAGMPISFSWTSASSWDNEASFTINNANNEVLFVGDGSDVSGVFFTADSCNAASTYVPDSMKVTVAVNDATMGTTVPAPGIHYFYEGDTCSVVAVPNTGYFLESWTLYVTGNGTVALDTTLATSIANVFDLFQGGWVVSHGDGIYEWTVTANFAAVPTCEAVTDLTATNVTETSVTISWTDSANANNYSVYNGSNYVATVNTNSYTFTGLTSSTAYTFGVRAVCAADDSSEMATINVTTSCGVINTFPYTQDFSGNVDCWTLIDADGDGNNWYIYEAAAQSASWNQTALTPDNWLVSPQFAIPATGNYEVTWTAMAQDQSWPAEHYGVFVSTTGNTDTADFTMIQQWTLSTGAVNPVVDLSNYAGDSIYIAIRHWNCTDMFRISIDNFVVRAQAGANEVVINVNQNNPAYGSVAGSGIYTIGDSVTVTATANSGYQFSRWVDANNVQVSTSNPYTFVAATDLTLTAIFLEAGATNYTITVEVNDSTMGTATGGGSYASGDIVTLTATPFFGYEFVNWTQISGFGENVVSTEATFTTTATGDKTFKANFQQATIIADSLTLNITVNDPTMGTTTPVPGVHRFGAGDTVVLSATPNTGYVLDSVHVAVSLMGIVLEDTTIVIPMLNQTIVIDSDYLGFTIDAMVYFSADSTPVETYYTVTLSSEDETMGTVSPAGATQVLAGTNFTATATSIEGYHFVAWKSGNAIMSVDSVYTFEVNQDMNLVAHFAENGTPEPNIYTVTVNYDSTMGVILGAGQYEEGTTATLTAQPKAGYRFVEWSTGETNTTITFTVTEDVTLNATFAPIDGIEDADMDNVTIYSTDSKIIVRGAEGYNVYVFDINGRMMDSQMNAAETIEFRMANTGIYLVKVGNASAKRVLVVR